MLYRRENQAPSSVSSDTQALPGMTPKQLTGSILNTKGVVQKTNSENNKNEIGEEEGYGTGKKGILFSDPHPQADPKRFWYKSFARHQGPPW